MTIYVLIDMSDKTRRVVDVFTDKEKAEEKQIELAKSRGIPDYLYAIDEFEVEDNNG